MWDRESYNRRIAANRDTRSSQVEASPRIELHRHSELRALYGDGALEAVTVHDTNAGTDGLRDEIARYELEWFDVEASSRRPPHATACVRTPDGEEAVGSFTGDGPIDAIFHAINAATGVDARLREFRVDAVTAGQDALGETSVVLEAGGVVGSGQGVSTDILEAAGRAYVRALSNALRRQQVQAETEAEAVPTPS
jgi:2-isopropylmalate synthase